VTAAQLPLIENPTVDADGWAAFLRRWAELGGGAIEVTMCKQVGDRWSVLAVVKRRDRIALHKPSPAACAEAIFGGAP